MTNIKKTLVIGLLSCGMLFTMGALRAANVVPHFDNGAKVEQTHWRGGYWGGGGWRGYSYGYGYRPYYYNYYPYNYSYSYPYYNYYYPYYYYYG